MSVVVFCSLCLTASSCECQFLYGVSISDGVNAYLPSCGTLCIIHTYCRVWQFLVY